MISQTAEYALRSVVCLAACPDSPLTSRQVSRVTQVPVSYLSKVLQALVRAGIVRSQRGLHGGFSLSKNPGELTLLEVINSVDPIRLIRKCPLDLEEHGGELCPLHRRLNDSIKMIEKAYQETTVQDLLTDPSPNRPLCDFTAGEKEILNNVGERG
ncbi:MAG: RrF2 family transcriptional regulator [Nitrospinaceae bacterium]